LWLEVEQLRAIGLPRAHPRQLTPAPRAGLGPTSGTCGYAGSSASADSPAGPPAGRRIRYSATRRARPGSRGRAGRHRVHHGRHRPLPQSRRPAASASPKRQRASCKEQDSRRPGQRARRASKRSDSFDFDSITEDDDAGDDEWIAD
jgi:hypothetical protein